MATLYCQIFRCSTFLLMLFALVRLFRSEKANFSFVLALTMLGGILFYLVWEAKASYNIPFLGVMTLLMAQGADTAAGAIAGYIQGDAQRPLRFKKAVCVAAACTLLFSVFELVVRYPAYTDTPIDRYWYAAAVKEQIDPTAAPPLAAGNVILEQNFQSDQAFNYLLVYAEKTDQALSDAVYQIELSDASGETLQSLTFTADDLQEDRVILNLDPVEPQGVSTYTVRLSGRSPDGADSLQFRSYTMQKSLPSAKYLRTDGTVQMDQGLCMEVFRLTQETYTSPKRYKAISVAIIAGELAVFLFLAAAFTHTKRKRKIENEQDCPHATYTPYGK